MISSTTLVATRLTSNGSGKGFLRIAGKSVLAVVVIATMLYLSAEPADLDLAVTQKIKECPIHHVPLAVARASIAYGDLNTWQADYFHASKTSFPYAGTFVFASTLSRFTDDTESSYRFARVWQCPECVRAEQRWYETGAKPK